MIRLLSFLNNGGLYVSWCKAIWENIVHLKFRILVWIVVQNKLLTADNFEKKNDQSQEYLCFL